VPVLSERQHRIVTRAAFGRESGARQSLQNVRGGVHHRPLDPWTEDTRNEVRPGVRGMQAVHVDVHLAV
jgi:hypothetical protein